MNIQQWLDLSELERVSFVARNVKAFGNQGSELFGIYNGATQKLQLELIGDRNVSSVRVSMGSEPRLPEIVVTSCYNEIGMLPLSGSTYLGFKVHHRALGKEISRYLENWILIFAKILDWTENQTKDWSKNWEESLTGIRPVFYHRAPSYYAADAIINYLSPNSITGLDRVRLRNDVIDELNRALQASGSSEMSDASWKEARRSIRIKIAAMTNPKADPNTSGLDS